MRCSQCGGDLGPQDANQLIASIAGSVMGDEQVDLLLLQPVRRLYPGDLFRPVSRRGSGHRARADFQGGGMQR
jgi:hypothetical protein